ncbi:hypothetical protein OR221_0011, partial [Microbacterium laevaniformans OR221]
HWDTAKTSTANNDSASPSAKGLNEGVLVEETGKETLVILLTSDEMSHIIWLLGRWHEGDLSIPRINSW